MSSMYNYLRKPNQCPWCLKAYERKAILEFHFNSTHSNMFNLLYQKFKTRRNLIDTYICKYDNCVYLPAKFTKYYVDDLKGGITAMYSIGINNCTKMFSTKLDMMKHFLKYNTNSVIKCKHCRNSFNSLDNLIEHMFSDHALLSIFYIQFNIFFKKGILKEFLYLYTISMGNEYICAKDEE